MRKLTLLLVVLFALTAVAVHAATDIKPHPGGKVDVVLANGSVPPGEDGCPPDEIIVPLPGPKGDTGATGSTGSTGQRGPQGPRGVPGRPVDYGKVEKMLQAGDTGVYGAGGDGRINSVMKKAGVVSQSFVTDRIAAAVEPRQTNFFGGSKMPTWLIVVLIIVGLAALVAAFGRRGGNNGGVVNNNAPFIIPPQGMQDPNRERTMPLDPHRELGMGSLYESTNGGSSTRYAVSNSAIIAGASAAVGNRAALAALLAQQPAQPAPSQQPPTQPAPGPQQAQPAQQPAPTQPAPTPPAATIKAANSGQKVNVANAPAGGKVHWGDGKDDAIPANGKVSHAYAAVGKYDVTVLDSTGKPVAFQPQVDVK